MKTTLLAGLLLVCLADGLLAATRRQTIQQQKADSELEYVYTRLEVKAVPGVPIYNPVTRTWGSPPLATKSEVYYFGFKSDGYFEYGTLASLTDGSAMRGRQRLGSGSFKLDGEKVIFTWADQSRSIGQLSNRGETLIVEGKEFNFSAHRGG
jgi:hypothetical protein